MSGKLKDPTSDKRRDCNRPRCEPAGDIEGSKRNERYQSETDVECQIEDDDERSDHRTEIERSQAHELEQ